MSGPAATRVAVVVAVVLMVAVAGSWSVVGAQEPAAAEPAGSEPAAAQAGPAEGSGVAPEAAPEAAPAQPAGASSSLVLQSVSEEQARQALEAALAYARAAYDLNGQREVGVPFQLGGQVSVERFLETVQADPEAAGKLGIDASGLVVQAYREALGLLKFLWVEGGREVLADDASSQVLFQWNLRPLPLEQLVPGDLIFFRDPASGRINGVALFKGLSGRRVDIVVASAREGKVIETSIDVSGSYWAERVAGTGRLAAYMAP